MSARSWGEALWNAGKPLTPEDERMPYEELQALVVGLFHRVASLEEELAGLKRQAKQGRLL